MPGQPAGMPLCFVTVLKWSHCWLLIGSSFLLFHRETAALISAFSHQCVELQPRQWPQCVPTETGRSLLARSRHGREGKKQHLRHVIKSAPVQTRACYFITLPTNACGTKAEPLPHKRKADPNLIPSVIHISGPYFSRIVLTIKLNVPAGGLDQYESPRRTVNLIIRLLDCDKRN